MLGWAVTGGSDSWRAVFLSSLCTRQQGECITEKSYGRGHTPTRPACSEVNPGPRGRLHGCAERRKSMEVGRGRNGGAQRPQCPWRGTTQHWNKSPIQNLRTRTFCCPGRLQPPALVDSRDSVALVDSSGPLRTVRATLDLLLPCSTPAVLCGQSGQHWTCCCPGRLQPRPGLDCPLRTGRGLAAAGSGARPP